MTEQPHLIGEKPVRRALDGRWTPQPAYEGWKPSEEPEHSSWWIVAACAVIAGLALWGLGR